MLCSKSLLDNLHTRYEYKFIKLCRTRHENIQIQRQIQIKLEHKTNYLESVVKLDIIIILKISGVHLWLCVCV